MDRDATFMSLALEEARVAESLGDVPIGAVLVRGDEVLARAGNARERDRDPTAHAEVLVIREASKMLGEWRLEGCELFVTLEPCAMCSGAMVLARLPRLVYATPDPKAASTSRPACSNRSAPSCSARSSASGGDAGRV